MSSRTVVRVFLLASLLFGGLLAVDSPAQAQEMAGYYETTDFLGTPPGSGREGLLGYANPALPALTGTHLVAAWSTDGRRALSVSDWGVFSNVGPMGMALMRYKQGGLQTTGYGVSLAGGSEAAAVGVGYQRFWGDATALGRYNRLTLGTISRPSPYFSVGLVGNVSLETDDREVVGTVGVRPFGTSRLTLFADAAWDEGQALVDVPWSAGAAVEVIPGLDLRGRVFDSEALSVGLRLELGRLGLDSQSRINPSGEYAGQVTRIRGGDYVPSAIAQAVRDGEEHVEPSLQGPLRYQKTRFSSFFEQGPPRFYEVLRTVRQATESNRVAAVAVNLSGVQVSPEQAWELRTALQEAQAAGTKVVAVLEGGSMTAYHLASGADVVALDPQGTLLLPGYAVSRTFVKGTLDKLGLGVQAWRFFEYKSAFERYSRTDYSRADSLQRQMYVDDQYDLMRTDVSEARPIQPDSLDRVIDEKTVVTAEEARRVGLVDTLARWHERSGLLEEVLGEETSSISTDHLHQVATARRAWGTRPEIAVVYGIGATQVEGGMGSRALSKRIRSLAEDEDVAAVVFRVDSPGGSPVAAAQVGEAIKTCAREKPVIVSQGQVAASGGYWVSTHADTIVAGPNTVTGSIGVIGGWIYDEGFSDKTGLSSDVVQHGERADLFQGLQLPLVGVSVPTRMLTDEEMARIEDVIRQGYDEFVATVAEGRDTTEAYVREIGEGRIYSGQDGMDVGLVDELGGLMEAVELARQAAGLGPEETEIREVNPQSGTIDFGQFLPGPLSGLADIFGTEPEGTLSSRSDPVSTYLRLVLEHQPRPLVLLPPGDDPSAE